MSLRIYDYYSLQNDLDFRTRNLIAIVQLYPKLDGNVEQSPAQRKATASEIEKFLRDSASSTSSLSERLGHLASLEALLDYTRSMA